MFKLILPLGSLAAGALIGSILTVNASLGIAKYLSIAILAALDSVLGGARALLEDSFDSLIMLSGFFVNALLAMGLAFLGDQIGIDMFMAASICFALRIFSNLAFIRRDIISQYRAKYARRTAQTKPPAAAMLPEGSPQTVPSPNLENTIFGLLQDAVPLANEAASEPPAAGADQGPVKVKAMLSPDKSRGAEEEEN